MSGIARRTAIAAMAVAAGLAQLAAATPVFAQGKPAITDAAVTFSEAGRGDKLRAWVDKVNKSHDNIEVQPIAMPFSVFANTVFTQMGGGGMTAGGVKG